MGNGNQIQISNEDRARRSATAGWSVNTTTTSPSSANYSVEADLVVKSNLGNEMVGLVGRMNTGTGATYMATWENSDNSWNLIKVLNSTTFNYYTFTAGQPDLVVGQTYRMRLEISGTTTTTLKLYVNGVLVNTATDGSSPFTSAGNAGIMDGANYGTQYGKSDTTGVHFDNFQVSLATYPRAADSKGNNTGDYENGPTLGATGALTGDVNTAATFDGVNDYVQVFPATALPAGATVRSTELWFKTSSALKQTLFRYGSGTSAQEYGLFIEANGASMTAWGHSGTNDKTFTMPYAVNDGAWHHVVQTYNGSSLTLYIDGVALPSQAATRNTVMDQYGFGIGAVIRPGDGNSGLFFNGSIDEVSFYNSTLTQTDVTNHHQLGTVVAPEPVITTTGHGPRLHRERHTTA